MTARFTLNSPLLLGFEHVERSLDRLAKSGGDGYPPYNIERRGDTGLRITLAVAGFSPADLAVQLEGDHLTVRGHQADEGGQRLFLHRGIAARQFQKSFLLAEGIEVLAASLEDGLLHIDLSQPAPQNLIRRVEIRKTRKNEEGATPLTVESREKAIIS